MDAKNTVLHVKHPSSLPRMGSNISPGCAPLLLCWPCQLVRVHPSQSEMKHLGGVEFSALESDWVELQAHKRSHRGDKKILPGVARKSSIFHWVLESIASGLHYFHYFLWGALQCTLEHPGCTPAVTVRFGVVRIRKWATIRGLIRASGRCK